MLTMQASLSKRDLCRRSRTQTRRSRAAVFTEEVPVNHSRWYDPAIGRWLSEDPSGFGGGDDNLYRYCGRADNPVKSWNRQVPRRVRRR
jgi:RHS repeat-associated protein